MINCIVAIEKSRGIGFKESMPWPRLSRDLDFFKEKTKDSVIIMGSATWRSLGRPLPDRTNIVISSGRASGTSMTFNNPYIALEVFKDWKKDVYIIGGQHLYDSTKSLVDRFYVTEIHADYACDRFFDIDYVARTCKNVSILEEVPATETTPAYTIKEYKR